MLTHSHYCKALDRTWSCTDQYCNQPYDWTMRPKPNVEYEMRRKQALREKRELMTKFNANMRLLVKTAYRK